MSRTQQGDQQEPVAYRCPVRGRSVVLHVEPSRVWCSEHRPCRGMRPVEDAEQAETEGAR